MALETPLARLTVRLVLIILCSPRLLCVTKTLGVEPGLRRVARSPLLTLLPRTVLTPTAMPGPLPLNVPVVDL